jgi:hypothetical protein
MESKEEIYLERAARAADTADWAESSGIVEIARLYRKVAVLWQDLASLEKSWPRISA